MADDPAEARANAASAGIAVGRLDFGDQHIIRRLDLALADVGAALHAEAAADVTLALRGAKPEPRSTRLKQPDRWTSTFNSFCGPASWNCVQP